eukprot:COSAG01_NODE_6871_length_3463_cov_17.354637_4_plen_186_part_00
MLIVVGVDPAVDLDSHPSNEIAQWVIAGLQHSHKHGTNNYLQPWHIICRKLRIALDGQQIVGTGNNLQIAVHFGRGHEDCLAKVAAADVVHDLQRLHIEETRSQCEFYHMIDRTRLVSDRIKTLEVQAVNRLTLRDEWMRMISNDTDKFDGEGRGPMVHPMRILPESGNGDPDEIYVVGERSFNW